MITRCQSKYAADGLDSEIRWEFLQTVFRNWDGLPYLHEVKSHQKTLPAINATRTWKQSLSRLRSHLGAKQGYGPKLGGKVTYTKLQNGISTLNSNTDSALEVANKTDISQNKVWMLSVSAWITFYTKICKQNNGIFTHLDRNTM